jgi:hypothetical protein
MATALFIYSLVARRQKRRGATKAELMAALLLPADGHGSNFSAVEEVLWALTAEDGLGALDPTYVPERFWLTIKQTLRMFFNSAKSSVQESDKLALVWETSHDLTTKGQFEEVHFIERSGLGKSLVDVAGGIDSQSNRLVVLDPREWTLLNGADEKSREAIRRILGLGHDPLIMDNAASCVIATVNTQRRRYAVEAAEAVLAWRLVLAQVVEEDERLEASRSLKTAEKDLNDNVRSAYQHYAYLVRRGEDLDIEFSRFDDDKSNSLNGDDVWGALVLAGRAVGDYYDPAEKRRKRLSLGEVYLATLLDSFDRHLTLKDVSTSFYKNPTFPLVPSLDEIRQVIFHLIQPAGHMGDGTGGLELVDGAGVRLEPQNPGQLAINSIQQQIRRAQADDSARTDDDVQGGGSGGEADSGTVAVSQSTKTSHQGTTEESITTYSWYGFDITNRSIADPAKREAIRKMLLWISSKLDEDGLDHQLITLRMDLNAATSDDLAQELELRARDIDAKWAVEEGL